MEENEEVPYLRQYPMTVTDMEYEKIFYKVNNGIKLEDCDIESINAIIANAKFWKAKYVNLSRKLREVVEYENVRL